MRCAGYPLLEIKEAGYLGHLRRADKNTGSGPYTPPTTQYEPKEKRARARGTEAHEHEHEERRAREVRRRSSAPVEGEAAVAKTT